MVILAKGLNLEHLPGHHHQIIQNPQPILWNFSNTYPVLTPVSLQFWLLGKMSENDDINSYKIYLDNNSNAQYIVVAQDSEVITSLCPHLFFKQEDISCTWLNWNCEKEKHRFCSNIDVLRYRITLPPPCQIVSKAVSNSSVTLAWLEPTTVFTNIAKYCIFHKVQHI